MQPVMQSGLARLSKDSSIYYQPMLQLEVCQQRQCMQAGLDLTGRSSPAAQSSKRISMLPLGEGGGLAERQQDKPHRS